MSRSEGDSDVEEESSTGSKETLLDSLPPPRVRSGSGAASHSGVSGRIDRQT